MANKIQVLHPEVKEGFKTGAYSPGVICDGWLYVSGQAAVDYPNGQYVLGTIEEETHRTMQNVQQILEAAGCTWDDVVKSTVHLADIKDFAAYNEVYASYFPGIKPARTTVQSGLGNGIKVEIDVVAKVP
ncbi:RidA family protein [Spirosoma taeanense]|uniref:RidA family protein n=1 Tax=Spirosoma taeanense TaxID=2735870 RepID=A0A6M5Y871_9BACT|nr:Rid family detoxifying hydrolase [Spirosoma taeanense]QJW90135.1 RidA family protein [Spirosoma taeanense]